MLGTDSIASGRSHVVLAGGMENMSLAPYLLSPSCGKKRTLGNLPLVDSVQLDGLTNSAATRLHTSKWLMGHVAQETAAAMKISKSKQVRHPIPYRIQVHIRAYVCCIYLHFCISAVCCRADYELFVGRHCSVQLQQGDVGTAAASG